MKIGDKFKRKDNSVDFVYEYVGDFKDHYVLSYHYHSVACALCAPKNDFSDFYAGHIEPKTHQRKVTWYSFGKHKEVYCVMTCVEGFPHFTRADPVIIKQEIVSVTV